MKKLLIAFLLVAVLLVVMVSPALAYGGDPDEGPHPPNDVWVPQKAFDARGETPPGIGTEWNNGAIFHSGQVF